jgi:sodium transport system ATP-binding protein
VIEVEGLAKRFGAVEAVRDVSFAARDGRITGLLGPNGAGKSTTMRVLATLLRPDDGRVEVAGVDLRRHPAEVRRNIGLVTEEPGLYERLTVREHLEFFGRAQGLAGAQLDARIDLVTEVLVLGDELDKRAGTLSKGNRQKVSLGRAIVHDPPVLLLDEPTSGLDVLATAGLEDLLADRSVTGDKTVLLSTHRIDEAERLATHIVAIDHGVIVAAGSPSEMARQTGTDDFRAAFVALMDPNHPSRAHGSPAMLTTPPPSPSTSTPDR